MAFCAGCSLAGSKACTGGGKNIQTAGKPGVLPGGKFRIGHEVKGLPVRPFTQHLPAGVKEVPPQVVTAVIIQHVFDLRITGKVQLGIMVIIFGKVVGPVFKPLPDVVIGAPATGDPGVTGVKDVVVKDIVPAGVDLHTAKDPPGAMGEDIAVDDLAADGIIQAEPCLAPDKVFIAGFADMMEVVVPEDIPA